MAPSALSAVPSRSAGTELVAVSARTPRATTTGPTTRAQIPLPRNTPCARAAMSDARMPVATGALESGPCS